MTLNYEQIRPFLDAGDTTAAEVLTAMQADRRTVRDIKATSSNPDETDLLDLLGEYGLMWLDGNATWQGPLPAAVTAANDPNLTAGMGRLYMNLQITDRPVRCGTMQDVAILTETIIGICKQVKPDQATALQAAMDAITGGWRWAGVTEEQIAAVMVAENRRAWAAAVRAKAEQAAEAAETESRKSDSTQLSIEAAADAVWEA